MLYLPKYSPLELSRTLLRWYISTFVTIYSIGEESMKVVIWRIFMELPYSDVFLVFLEALEKQEDNGKVKKPYQQEPLKHEAQIEDLKTSLRESEEEQARLQHQLLGCKTQLEHLQAKSKKEQHKYQEAAEKMRQRILHLELLLSKFNPNNEQLKDQTSSMDKNQLDQGQTHVATLEPHMTSSCLKEETQECPNETQGGKNAQQTKIQKTLNKIQEIRQDIENITKEVEDFSGSQEDKTFLHLKEMLIQNVLKLDNVESEGNNIIRQERKEVIKRAHQVLRDLIDRCSQ